MLTQAEYARHRGVSQAAVYKMVQSGRIPVKRRNGKVLIDPAEADVALGENIARIEAAEAPDDGRDEAPFETPARSIGGEQSVGLTRARTVTEVFKARIAEVEFKKKVGELVEAAQVTEAAARCGEAAVRAVALALYGEALLAAALKDGVAGVRGVLRDMEYSIRRDLATAFEQMAAAALAGGGDGQNDGDEAGH